MNRATAAAIALITALSATAFVLQAVVVRPHLYPAGAGFITSGDAVMNELGEPAAVGVAHLPDLRTVLDRPVTVTEVWPGSPADRAGLAPGAVITAVESAGGFQLAIGPALPADPLETMAVWRTMYRLMPTGAITLTVVDPTSTRPRQLALERPSVWSLDRRTLAAWFFEYHGGPLAKHLVFTLAALVIVALGARGLTATLMTLAFLLMAIDNGPLMGAEFDLRMFGPVMLAFSWTVLAFSFPVIGLAILHFPSRAPVLSRHPWIAPSLPLLSLPLLVIGALATAYLLGVDAVGPAIAWLGLHPGVFNTFFTLGVIMNFVLVLEAVQRYHTILEPAERRRIQTVIATAVPGTVAFMAITALPLGAASLGMPFRWPWPIAVMLQFIVLLSAFGMAYAVAVRRAMSPRTALRQGIQYALARKTLGVLTALPAVALVVSLIRQSDKSLSMILESEPLFYIGAIVLIAVGLRYRDRAQKWLDRRFFRAEYDAREILLSLASRVPQETDPRALLSLVLSDVESALHPVSLAVLAEQGKDFEVVEAREMTPPRLPANSGLLQLLQWSDAPLEVFLDDPRSTLKRLPAVDREWLRASGAALLVPIAAGSGVERPLVGIMVLGPKRSEEPYTGEDRRLLAGIAAQMGLALDLSRLRRQVAATPRAPGSTPMTTTASELTPSRVVDVGVTVDGKYRIDALIGRGGMGAVYRARDVGLERDVAVKVVRGDLIASTEARERFKREAQLAARLQHPAIVTVFDFGTMADGSAYLVMEYVRGEDLRARLTRGTLDWTDTARLLAAIADGVDAAHRAHILHRDLKPENILLPEQGGGPKVLDFGVAKAMAPAETEATMTARATIVGTPAYMAPEQLRGGAVDSRTDVYSLAVMTYEMLTGRLPFGQGSFVDVAVRQTPEGPPLDVVPLPERLLGVLRSALSFEPDRRPATAMAFATALRRAMGD